MSRQIRVTSVFVLLWLVIGSCFGARAQSAATLLEPRTYFTDAAGKHKSVKERWNIDVTGEKHGTYLAFNPNGLLVESAIFNHGVHTGPGVHYQDLDNALAPLGQKRPNTKYVGNYSNGAMVGRWVGTDDVTKAHVITVEFNEVGEEQRVTFYQKGQVVRVVDTQLERARAHPSYRPPFSALARQQEDRLLEAALQGIGFEPGGYALNAGGQELLNTLVKAANQRLNAGNQIVLVYLAVYAKPVAQAWGEKKAKKRSYELTVNRAFALKRFLARGLNENISVIAYACGESLTYFRDGCVKVSFRGDLGPDRQVAEDVARQYGLPAAHAAAPDEPTKAAILLANHL